jgi:hypothetical protein
MAAALQGIALSEPIAFSEFVNVISRQSLVEMDQHIRSQYHQGCFSIVDFDFVGRMEALSTDLIYVLECIKAPEPVLAQAYRRNHQTGSSIELWDAVPADLRRLFLRTFEIDFDVLQYPFRLPEHGQRRH